MWKQSRLEFRQFSVKVGNQFWRYFAFQHFYSRFHFGYLDSCPEDIGPLLAGQARMPSADFLKSVSYLRISVQATLTVSSTVKPFESLHSLIQAGEFGA